MADPIGTPAQLAYLLGEDADEVDTDRATFLIQLATDLASGVVDPVPSGALGTVLQIAVRAYIAPAGVSAETTGPTTAQLQAGLYMTRAERRAIRRAAGLGNAFSIDPTPSGAGDNLAWWDMYNGDGPFPFGWLPGV